MDTVKNMNCKQTIGEYVEIVERMVDVINQQTVALHAIVDMVRSEISEMEER